MKAPILGLAIATVAFAGSSVYLWQQLDQERARAVEVGKKSAQLEARLAQLEKARAQLAERRMASTGNFTTGQIDSAHPAAAAPPPPAAELAQSAKSEDPVWTMRRPERSPAFQKMMRSQIRANNKRVYSDVGTKLGLDKETTNKLIDLLTEQQVPNFDAPRDINDPTDWQRYQEEKHRQDQARISDLIGPDKAVALQEYQETLPARMEVDMLARQLEGYDAALSADQRKRLIDVYVEERKRVPMPEGYEGMDPETYQKSVASWQDDYNRRTAEEAQRILSSDQLTAFNEMQQWQKEMRENMANMPPPGAPARFRRGMAGGNAVMFTTAAPVAISASGSVAVAAPAPASEQKKP
ncbi:MAG TPA: hypothetical protein VJP84_17715 [Steroidobacteraceae bacterium]|jgi:hypothetical protein|nr:hypothetical protein [Steroidobacteraceae bacterium]